MPETRRPHIPAALRRQVMARANHRCEYCQCPETFSLDTFCVDHIHPTSDGGATVLENLACACNNCNSRKLDAQMLMDAETGHAVPLFSPRTEDWRDHFAWSSDTLQILPRTATGRVTESRLQLNRQGAINIRRALLALGEPHPPKETLQTDRENR
jgi:HNH endonuclease